MFINVTDMMLSDDEAWSRWKLVFIHRMAGTIVLSTALHTVAVRIDSARIRPRPFKICKFLKKPLLKKPSALARTALALTAARTAWGLAAVAHGSDPSAAAANY